MPHAAELEEYGLEVEHEHHALVAPSLGASRQPASLGAITSTLGTTRSRSRINLRPGMLKWATLVIVLALAAVYHLGQENEETLEESTPQDLKEKFEDTSKNNDGAAGKILESNDLNDTSGYEIGVEPDGHGSVVSFKPPEENEEWNIDEASSDAEKNMIAEEKNVHPGESEVNKDEEPGYIAKKFEEDAKENLEESKGLVVEEPSDLEKFDKHDISNVPTDHSSVKDEDSMSDLVEKKSVLGEEKETADEVLDNMGTFTLDRLHATRNAANSLISMLEEYYYGKEKAEKMFNSWLDPWDYNLPENEKNKTERLSKVVDTIARALVTDDQTEFLIGTIGSSVAAGHDNCHYDSYESQLERTFGPVWEAAGMKFVNQNAGEGGGCGDDHKNQVFCVTQNVSPNIDILHYSWTYFEVGANPWPDRENLIRWIQMLPKQPPLHVINVQLFPDEWEMPFETNLLQYYSKYGYNAYYIKEGYIAGGYDYKTENENGIDRFGWGYVGDGYHNVTRYGENETNPDRYESLGVVMRNWHPGPLMFQLLSDALSYSYTKAMQIALDSIEKEITNGKDPREKWSASKRKIFLKKSLPNPLYCDPQYCVVDEAPKCLNFELPTFGQWGPRIEDPNDSLNPHKGELQNWEIWHEDDGFFHMVGRQDTAIFQDRKDKHICKHLDACGGVSATSSDNGMVVFRLPKMEVGLVAICGCCGKEVAAEMFINNTNIEVHYNGAKLDSSTWDLFPTKKCARLLKRFPTEGAAAQTPTGHAYLAVKVLNGQLSQPVRISHVITL